MTIKREVIIGDCRLILGDCREILPTLGKVDAVVTDPPYGIGEAAGKAKARTSGLASRSRDASRYRRDYGVSNWDDDTADDEVAMAVKMARWSIVFGGNYYDLPPTSCWLVWDKLNGDTDFADCELAWTNLPKAVRRIRFLWNGCMRMERDIKREHPTQKPLEVMRWCIGHLPDDVVTILDPFAGSGTTMVAAAKLGKHGVGIEREEKYFDIACKRIRDAYAQPDMFIDSAKPQPPKQLDLMEAAE
jgi:DNA modification methylase